ncbi:hypothetical protein Hdeb2414_s0006g00194771 [Helianthus debilis subsp. tardiflorus]
MNDLGNCHDFFSLSLPPAERMYQKRRNRFELLDDHVRAGVNFFATSQEIVREWRLVGEETADFKDARKVFAAEKDKFNAEKKGLQWRVADAERKLEQEKQVNIQKQKDWESACERTNVEMQSQREAIVRLSGEKKELVDEANKARVAFEKKEKEYVERIYKLELLVKQKVSECEAAERLHEEKTSECQASELLVEEMSADCKWLLSRAVPLLADRIVNSRELATYMFELGQAGYNSGRKDGYSQGRSAAITTLSFSRKIMVESMQRNARSSRLWSLPLLRLLKSYHGNLMVLLCRKKPLVMKVVQLGTLGPVTKNEVSRPTCRVWPYMVLLVREYEVIELQVIVWTRLCLA